MQVSLLGYCRREVVWLQPVVGGPSTHQSESLHPSCRNTCLPWSCCMCRHAPRHRCGSLGLLPHKQLPDPAEVSRGWHNTHYTVYQTQWTFHPIARRCKAYTRFSHIEKTRFRNRHGTHIYLHKVSLLFWKVKRAPTKLWNPSEWNKLRVNLVLQTTLFAERGRVWSSFVPRPHLACKLPTLQHTTRKPSALELVLGVGPRAALVMLQALSCHHSRNLLGPMSS